jgi:hypothetical protein
VAHRRPVLLGVPAALGMWAGDEVLRGVNPFRPLLDVAVIAWLGLALVRLG